LKDQQNSQAGHSGRQARKDLLTWVLEFTAHAARNILGINGIPKKESIPIQYMETISYPIPVVQSRR
jgi:hypothetical protein